MGPLKVIWCNDQTVAILENGVDHTVSVDRYIRAMRPDPTLQVRTPTQTTPPSPIGQDRYRTPLGAITDRRSPTSTLSPQEHAMQAGNKDITADPTVPSTVFLTANNQTLPNNESVDTEGAVNSIVGHKHTMLGNRYHVRRYVWTAFLYTMEPSHRISNSIFISYWRRLGETAQIGSLNKCGGIAVFSFPNNANLRRARNFNYSED